MLTFHHGFLVVVETATGRGAGPATAEEVVMSVGQKTSKPRLPPPWIIRFPWSVHRGLDRMTGGRLGLRRPRPGRWGTVRLTDARAGVERPLAGLPVTR